MLETTGTVAERLARVQAGVAEAALRARRRPEEVSILAVAKTHPAEAVVEAIAAGLFEIGENRVQEAAEKVPAVTRLLADAVFSPPNGVRWHMIGHLQTNKTAAAVGLFDCVDSVDSLHLAQTLSRRVQAGGGITELAVRLEVYVGDDPRRPGLRPDALVDVAGQILELPGLRVEGLMSVAPLGGDARAAFGQVRELRDTLAKSFASVHFGVLSMGMSDDYQLAIQEGSTEVRIGTALFGSRIPR
jgi:pyridoxal phosphate enzyme (YggS family)